MIYPLSIKATGFRLTAALRDYVEKKVSALEKFMAGYHPAAKVVVEVARTTRHHKNGLIHYAEIQVTPPHSKKGLRASAEALDVYAALDWAKDEMKRELLRVGGRAKTLARVGGRAEKRGVRALLFS